MLSGRRALQAHPPLPPRTLLASTHSRPLPPGVGRSSRRGSGLQQRAGSPSWTGDGAYRQEAPDAGRSAALPPHHPVERVATWWHELQKAFKRTDARLVLEGAQLAASLLFIGLYVHSTYHPILPGTPLYWLDVVLCCIFAADYVYRLMGQGHPVKDALTPLNLIDLLSFAPTLLEAFVPFAGLGLKTLGVDLRWVRIFRALRLLRLSLLIGNVPQMRLSKGALLASAVNVPLMWLLASVVSWLFTAASLVHLMEKMPWHDALYFVTSTITTVGYGDVVITSHTGRMLVLAMMAVGVVWIPVRASQLYSQLSSRRLCAGRLPSRRRAFVLLSARLSEVRGFNDFLQDFLAEVRSGSGQLPPDPQLVCICNKPSFELQALQELNDRHLTLMEGSVFAEGDLERARACDAAAALVLADRFTSNAAQEDTDVQFRVWALKSYTKKVPLYVQVLQKSAMERIQPFLDPQQDVLQSIEATRHRLLALSCVCHGASTLLSNLLRSSGTRGREAGDTLAGRRWLRQYADGCHAELAFPVAAQHLQGVPFWRASEALYTATGCVIIGLVERSGRLVLNPSMSVIEQEQELVVLAPSRAAGLRAARLLRRPASTDGRANGSGSGSDSGGDEGSRAAFAALKLPLRPQEAAVGFVPHFTYDLDSVDSIDGGAAHDLLHPCLASWTPSYESDSIDEEDLCTDEELREAAESVRKYNRAAAASSAAAAVAAAAAAGVQGVRAAVGDDGRGGGIDWLGAAAGAEREAAAEYQDMQRRVGSNAEASTSTSRGGSSSSNISADAWSSSNGGAGASSASGSNGSARSSGRGSGSDSSSDSVSSTWDEASDGPAPLAGAPPRQLTGHVIMSGSEGSFLPFSRQLQASFGSGNRAIPLVVLHPHEPTDVLARLRRTGAAVYFVRGRPSDPTALEAARSRRAKSLVYLGPLQRPGSGQAIDADDYGVTSRAAVLADSEALLTCYGVGEELLPTMTNAVVELCFTSSIRFLQPGLMLLLQGSGANSPRSKRPLQQRQGSPTSSNNNSTSSVGSSNGGIFNGSGGSGGDGDGVAGGSSAGLKPKPRSSWRHRKLVEDEGRAEGLTEWQVNAYYCGGRVVVPSLLDTFTCQGFFKRRRLVDLLTEIAGDDGRPGGAMLQQSPLPPHLIGHTYAELVSHYLLSQEPSLRHVPLGLLRRKSENRAWRLPYVALHPAADTVLEASDLIYSLRPRSAHNDGA